MFSGRCFQSALGAFALFVTAPVLAQVTTYCCDAAAEAAYRADLAGLVVQPDVLQESFEDGPWIAARTVPQISVNNLGVTWSRPGAYLSTSTGGGDVHDGSYLMFTFDVINGLPVHAIPDSYTLVTDATTLYGVGGWFTANGAKLGFIVDGDPQRVDFTGAEATVGAWKFLGFIETLGFGTLEIGAVEEVGNETSIFFSDNFSLGIVSGITPTPGSLQFSATEFSVAESGASVSVSVTRTGGSAGAVTVDYASSDGSATAGSDYVAMVGTLNFADGVISQSFDVAIFDDSLFEGDETLTMNLSNVSGGASLGTPSTANITIIEDDQPPPAGSLQFSAPAFSVAESGVSVVISVTRTGGSAGSVTVDYASSDGSATAGSDYTDTAGTLDFADGVISQSFDVVIVDDSLFEGNETFNLSLSNVSGGATLGTPSTANVSIIEDDQPPSPGSLQFNAEGFSVAESGASVTISVTRTGGSAGSVTVDYASSDGSATAGSDYTAMAGTLDFADGVISQSFDVVILDDTLFEGDEIFNLNLSNISGGATLGTPAAASVTITDDDPPPLQDTNGDGLADADAIALGLDPNDPDGDTDNDGISDVLEVGIDVNNPLDGDVDGVIDALEPGTDAADAMIASGVPLHGGGTVTITTAVGETLSGVSSAAATGGPAGINFPVGTVSYTTSAAAGGSVPVQLEFSADLPANLTIYKVDHSGVYRELATSLWTRVSPRRIDLTLTDGDPLTDLDGIVNASIEDPIAPAEVVPLADSSALADSSGGGGCVNPAFGLFSLVALFYRLRRYPG